MAADLYPARVGRGMTYMASKPGKNEAAEILVTKDDPFLFDDITYKMNKPSHLCGLLLHVPRQVCQ